MTSPSNDNETKTGQAPCPICNAPPALDYAPFCSRRCADVDLHRWLSGGYAIPASEDDSEGAADQSEES